MNTQPEPICIDLTDGSNLRAMMHIESGKLHLDCGWLGSFVIQPESAKQVCSRILYLCSMDRWPNG